VICSACGFLHGDRNGCPPVALVRRARAYIAKVEAMPPRPGVPQDVGGWQFATTMADNPHWYEVRGRAWDHSTTMGQGYEALWELVRWHYVLRWWHLRGFRSIDLDGWAYWVGEESRSIINRKPVEAAGWDKV